MFNEFTKLSPIVKTITAELKPVGQTAETYKEQEMDRHDEYLRELVEKATPYIDLAVRTIVNDALNNTSYDFSQAEDRQDELKYEFLQELDKAAKSTGIPKIKDINSGAFITALPDILKDKGYTDESAEAALICAQLKGKSGFMAHLLTTRVTAATTWCYKRIIENLGRYKANTAVISKLLESNLRDQIISLYGDVDSYADISGYNKCLSQDEIDSYNRMINGIVTDKGIEKKGLIMLVNENNMNKSNKKLPAPKELYKQILMPKTKAFQIETINNDDELKELIKETSDINIRKSKEILEAVKKVDADGLVVDYNRLHMLSHIVYGSHRDIPDKIIETGLNDLMLAYEEAKSAKDRRAAEKAISTKEKELKKKEYTFSEIEDCMGRSDICKTYIGALTGVAKGAENISVSLVDSFDTMRDIRESKDDKVAILNYYNAWTEYRDLLHIVTRRDINHGDNVFYNVLDEDYTNINAAGKTETMFIGYVTRKPGDVAVKNLTVLGSDSRITTQWLKPDGKFSINNQSIIKREGKYYLFILTKGTKPINIKGDGPSVAFAQKKAANPVTDLPKFIFTRAGKYFTANPGDDVCIFDDTIKPFSVTRALYELYKSGTYKVNSKTHEVEDKDALEKILATYKDFMAVHKDYSQYNISLKPISEYANAGDFFNDVKTGSFFSTWFSVDDETIDRLVGNGEAMLFEISTRTLYTEKKRKKAFDELILTALSDDAMGIQLLSGMKIYMRKKTINHPIVHKKGSVLVNRYDKDGNRIPEDVYLEIYGYYNDKGNDISEEARRYIKSDKVIKFKATQDITKDGRYSRDVFSVAIPLKLNATTASSNNVQSVLNHKVEAMKDRMNAITIIRTDRDLVYYTITSPDGTLIDMRSLNIINGHDYWTELKEISDLRREEKSTELDYTRKVKDIRNAYISLAVTEIAKKVVEHNAYIIIEKISDEIKDKMSALDNTVYKGFEAALTSRLACLSFKDIPKGEPGSVANPYQLCIANGNEYQNGIVYYVTNAYTGSADLDSGFVNVFDLHNIRTKADMRHFLSKFDEIIYDENKNRFIFRFNYDNFTTKKIITNKQWAVVAGGPAVIYNREYKRNTYIPETAEQVKEVLAENHNLHEDFAALAFDEKLSGKESEELFNIFRQAIWGTIKAHDAERKQYISPITGKITDYSLHLAQTLRKKASWQDIEKIERGEWIDSIS